MSDRYASKKSFYVRQQWLKFKRLSKEGPFYRLMLLSIDQFWKTVGHILWQLRGEQMDCTPGPWTVPRLFVRGKTTHSVSISWAAKASSRFSRDAFELEVRGAIGPVGNDLSTDWVRAAPRSNETTFTMTQIEAGQCVEFRCRTVNSKGESEWSKLLRVYTRQAPDGNGGRGPNYHWRQTNSKIQVIVNTPEDTTNKMVELTCTRSHLWLALKLANGSKYVLLSDASKQKPGALFQTVKPGETEWDIEVRNVLLPLLP